MRLGSSPILKKKHVSRLNKLLSWNGFPNYIRKRLLLKFKTDFESNSKRKNNTNDDDKNDELSIILKLPYMGPEGEKLVRTLRKKISKNISRKLLIKIIWTTTKISDFCSIKDKLPNEQKNQIIYNITCPACGEKYVGKTECCFKTRMDEHGTRAEQPMFQHLLNCSAFSYLMHLHDMPSKNNEERINQRQHIHHAVLQNSRILTHSRDWLELCFLESFLIKKIKPKINYGIKAAKELQLF